jgi:thiopeptide-type bacteriocin biosynthesis protein
VSEYRASGFFVLRTPLLPFAAQRGLREALDDPLLRAGITLASPSIDAAIAHWQRDPTSRRGRKTERALMRYVTRAATRPTPFGLFAGVSVGAVGDRTRLELPAREHYAASSRVSLAWATGLAGRMAERPELIYRPNSTLYRLPGRWRYVARREQGGRWIHSLRELRDGPALALVLDRARDGATSAQLAEALAGRAGEERARTFVRELIERQIVVRELPPVTGGGDLPEPVREAVAELERAGQAPPQTVQLRKPARDLTIGAELIAELTRGVEVLRRWAAPAIDPLADFREAFQRRYGWREVPLAEAIDAAAGVGLDVLDEPDPAAAAEDRDRLLLAKVTAALHSGAGEIVVEADELERDPPPLPPSFVVAASVAAASAAAIDRGDFRVWLKYASGPDAVGTFARFCPDDPELDARVREHLRAEEALDPDAVHAEIAHLPQLEWAAAVERPLLRDVEIDYLGPSGAPPERRLRLADLLISVAGDRVRLRSAVDGRWVVPRLSSALNLDLRLPPAFRLLALIGAQDGVELSWGWGALRSAPYHPRVRSGRTILAPAHWRLGRQDLEPVATLRERLGLPRHVAVVESLAKPDHVLPVDLDSAAGVELLRGLAGDEVHLLELLPDPAELCVEGPEGRFTHELLVPFLGRAVRRRAPARPAPAMRRSFPPGSEWLYVKLYCGSAATDRVLRQYVGPLCERLTAEGAVQRWHFLRYLDPELHVRLRLYGEPAALRESALPLITELSEGLLERRLIWRTTLDTYERDVESPGGPVAAALFDDWFHADSEAAVHALAAAHREGDGPERRWRLALQGTDAVLAAFALGPAARVELMRSARQELAELEAPGDSRSFATRYGARHRAERDELEHALRAARDGVAHGPLRAYAERAGRFAAIAAALAAAHAEGEVTRPLTELAVSLVHLRINRLLRLGSLEPEVRLYDALERLYSSDLARTGSH